LKETKVRLRRHDLTGRIPIDDLLVACRRSKGLLITQILASINLEQWLVDTPKGGGGSTRVAGAKHGHSYRVQLPSHSITQGFSETSHRKTTAIPVRLAFDEQSLDSAGIAGSVFR